MPNHFNQQYAKININADDFGYNAMVNRAIYKSFQSGLIQSTSMMVNKEGLDDAIKILQSDFAISQKTGLHFNLTEGFPLTDSIKSCRRFCNASGEFIFKRQKPLVNLSEEEERSVYDEMLAQMEVLRTIGMIPHHIDSHHHIHTEWPILNLVIRLANKYGVQKIRLARNMGIQNSFFKKQYRNLLNTYLKYRVHLVNSDLFGDLDDYTVALKNGLTKNRYIEIMVHPKMHPDQETVFEKGKDFKELLASLMPESTEV